MTGKKSKSTRAVYWDAHSTFDRKFQTTVELIYKITGYTGIYSRTEIIDILIDDFLKHHGDDQPASYNTKSEVI